jgi:hypothetical protein
VGAGNDVHKNYGYGCTWSCWTSATARSIAKPSLCTVGGAKTGAQPSAALARQMGKKSQCCLGRVRLNLKLLKLFDFMNQRRAREVVCHCRFGKNRSAALSVLLRSLHMNISWSEAVTLFAFDYGHW